MDGDGGSDGSLLVYILASCPIDYMLDLGSLCYMDSPGQALFRTIDPELVATYTRQQ